MKAAPASNAGNVLSPSSSCLDMQERVEGVWRDRALRLSGRPLLADKTGGEAADNARPVMVLGLGAERYAIELPDVAEVLPPVQATPVPGAAPPLTRIINFHGEIRPVIDLRLLLEIETVGCADPATLPARVILLRREGREIGLQVDRVEQIRWIDPRDFETRGNCDADLRPANLSRYVRRSTRDLLMLLSMEALFAGLDG